MREGRAICRVRAAVDLKDGRILLCWRESWRLENPALDPRAIERSYPEGLRLREIERREKRGIRIGNCPQRGAGPGVSPGSAHTSREGMAHCRRCLVQCAQCTVRCLVPGASCDVLSAPCGAWCLVLRARAARVCGVPRTVLVQG